MSGIIDTHFHIWNFDLRKTYKKTDGSFDWPDESLPKVRVKAGDHSVLSGVFTNSNILSYLSKERLNTNMTS